jgi:hypothetical protein
MNKMKNYTIQDRIKITLDNIEHQGGQAHWDDLEKLEHILAQLILGQNIKDEFNFVNNHFSVIKHHFKQHKK